jgi:ATP-dependent RNA helicase DDX56/DBP9
MKRKLNEDDVPDANIDSHAQSDQSSFGAFGLDSRLLQALAQEDFTVPTLVQAKAIPLALEGKDILGTSSS